jgi:hypothetical protein
MPIKLVFLAFLNMSLGRKKKGLWLHPPKRVKLSKDQNESTESRDSTTNTQTTTPVNQ